MVSSMSSATAGGSAAVLAARILIGGGLPILSEAAAADVPQQQCTTDSDCAHLLHPLSKCIMKKKKKTSSSGIPAEADDDDDDDMFSFYCSNPYASGCLRTKLGTDVYPNKRVCNSDDDDEDSSPNCDQPEFDYNEIRIGPGDWESSIFQSLLMQIILSELLGVPATIEAGGTNTFLSFYDDESKFPYPTEAYWFEELQVANNAPNGGDCRPLLAKGHRCAHVMPEAWSGQRKAWEAATNEGFIESAEGTAMIAKVSWYIPKFLALDDPSLTTIFGLSGQKNRHRLANTFRRPTTWEEYCTEVSECQSPDDFAERAPTPEEIEEGKAKKYRVSGIYKGHFRLSSKNDCTGNRTETCTGHIVDSSCKWSTSLQQQAYWNDIALESEGPLEPNGGYSYGDMLDIWYAANETKSPVMMWWWTPDPTVQMLEGTDAAFVPINLNPPTEECRKGRITSEDRCSDDVWARRGSAEGRCDDPAHALRKIITASLAEQTYAATPAARSPGYDAIKNFVVDDLSMNTMLGKWMERGQDTWGFDPREAVCSWLADQIEDVASLTIPRGYPRELVLTDWYSVLINIAFAFGAISVVVVAVTFFFTYEFRGNVVIKSAQFDFLAMVLAGLLLWALAAIAYAVEPSTGSCVAEIFLFFIGYTLSMVPLLVKVIAINKMMQKAKKMKRVKIKRRNLYGRVAIVTGAVAIFLAIWSAVDTPTRQETLVLVDEGSGLVQKQVGCSSSSGVWMWLAIGWQFLLLLCTCVLAYQGRKIPQDFNESMKLANLVYVHFLFLIFRAIVYYLWYTMALDPMVQSGIDSLLISCDMIASVGVYFGPKFHNVYNERHGRNNAPDPANDERRWVDSQASNTSSAAPSLYRANGERRLLDSQVSNTSSAAAPSIRPASVGIRRLDSLVSDTSSAAAVPSIYPANVEKRRLDSPVSDTSLVAAPSMEGSGDDSWASADQSEATA